MTLSAGAWSAAFPLYQFEHPLRLGACRGESIGLSKRLAPSYAFGPPTCGPASVGVEAAHILQPALMRLNDQDDEVISVIVEQDVHR